MPGAALAAGCLLLAALLATLAWLAWRGRAQGERFFTRYAAEEPTRSYVPYTGAVAVGAWGAEPWGEAAAPWNQCAPKGCTP